MMFINHFISSQHIVHSFFNHVGNSYLRSIDHCWSSWVCRLERSCELSTSNFHIHRDKAETQGNSQL